MSLIVHSEVNLCFEQRYKLYFPYKPRYWQSKNIWKDCRQSNKLHRICPILPILFLSRSFRTHYFYKNRPEGYLYLTAIYTHFCLFTPDFLSLNNKVPPIKVGPEYQKLKSAIKGPYLWNL